MPSPKEIHDRLKSQFPGFILDFVEERIDPYTQVKPEALARVAAFIKNDSELAFNYLVSISSLDEQGTLNAVYHLQSVDLQTGRTRHGVILKVCVPVENPVIPSVAHIWPTADWQERECYDLMGIRFSGHPDLKRILTEEGWVGHPLRKDYVFPTEYRGIDLT